VKNGDVHEPEGDASPRRCLLENPKYMQLRMSLKYF